MLAGSLAHCPELAAITDEKWCYMEWERARTAQQRTGSMTILQPPPPLFFPPSTVLYARTHEQANRTDNWAATSQLGALPLLLLLLMGAVRCLDWCR